MVSKEAWDSATVRRLQKSVLAFGVVKERDILKRFWKKVKKTEGCWEWTAYIRRDGYGQWGTRYMKLAPLVAHRVSYCLLIGPIREGMTIDHLCRNRKCVNPEHLEMVTQRENILRGVGLSAMNARKTHCPKGHPLSGDNLASHRLPVRVCRTCASRRCREYRLGLLERTPGADLVRRW